MQAEILEKTIEVRDQLGAEVKRVKEAVGELSASCLAQKIASPDC